MPRLRLAWLHPQRSLGAGVTAIGVLADEIVYAFLWARLNGDATLRSILSVPAGESRVANMVGAEAWGDGSFVVFA